jgi:hypothetical protein
MWNLVCPVCFASTDDPYTTMGGLTVCWDCFNDPDVNPD